MAHSKLLIGGLLRLLLIELILFVVMWNTSLLRQSVERLAMAEVSTIGLLVFSSLKCLLGDQLLLLSPPPLRLLLSPHPPLL
jgi:hypothetical protein